MRRRIKLLMWLTLVVLLAVQLRAFTFFPHGYAFLVKLAFFSARLVG